MSTPIEKNTIDLKLILDAVIALPEQGGGTVPADPVIQELIVTENGTYNVPDDVDGYSPVIVNVPTGGAATVGTCTVNMTYTGVGDGISVGYTTVNDDGAIKTASVWVEYEETVPLKCVCGSGVYINHSMNDSVEWDSGFDYSDAELFYEVTASPGDVVNVNVIFGFGGGGA